MEANFGVVNSGGDADCEIVKRALQFKQNGNGVVLVVADDTDIAVMLLYHWSENSSDIHLLQERSKKYCSNIDSQNGVKEIKEHLLFLHAWSGSDTTSATYGKGKGTVTTLITKSEPLQIGSRIILDQNKTKNK
jgi:hypothetical protein